MKYLGLFLLFFHLCNCYRVLVLFPYASKSHSILGNGVVRNLLEAGHEVTYVTPYPGTLKHTNLSEVDVSDVKDYIPGQWLSLQSLIENGLELTSLHQLSECFKLMDLDVMQNKNMLKLLNDTDQKFDVIIIEWIFSEYLSGLSSVYGCPYVWVAFYDPHWATLSLIDEATNPAYVPTAISSNMPPFSFTERLQELWSQFIHNVFIIKNLYITGYDQQMYEKMFTQILAKRGRTLPSYAEVRYNASLILGNSHTSLGLPVSLPQNYKGVGGYYIDPEVPTLPKEIKSLMDEAKHGVIYFSMGTMLKGKDLPDVLKKSLLEMFKELKQTVFWKLEENFDDLPENVHVLRWAPQQGILAHPNCRLFITHGGLLSTTEAVHYGIPIIGVPMLVDQFNNINKAVKRGFAQKVKMSLNITGELKTAIFDMLEHPKYSKKAKELSTLYHDRPIPPSKELVYWVEHVVRTRGALHLRSPALKVPWYQKIYLDFIIILVVVIALSAHLCRSLIRYAIDTKIILTKKYI